MEFGFLTQGYVPEYRRRDNPNAEHEVLIEDYELCLAADEAILYGIFEGGVLTGLLLAITQSERSKRS